MYSYAYQHYLDQYDFFFFCGDDTYVIAENLRFIISKGSGKGPFNDSKPILLGAPEAMDSETLSCLGGAGYAVNQVALKVLVEDLLDTPACFPHYPSHQEDRFISNCFQQIGIQCLDTNDEFGEATFHYGDIQRHANWTNGVSDKNWKYSAPIATAHRDLPNLFDIAWKEGMGQISKRSVSFHLRDLASGTGMQRYHSLLYGLC